MSTHWKNSTAGYGWPAIGFHWLTLLLLVAVYSTMEFKSIYPKNSPGREWIMNLHYMLGLAVFVLVWLRLLVRVTGASPAVDPPMPAWQAATAKAMHWALYALMAGLPVLGWLTLSAKGVPIPFFGMELPALLGEDKALGKQLKDIHETLATAGYFLVGLHAAAALYHHYWLRDNTLRLMLPRR